MFRSYRTKSEKNYGHSPKREISQIDPSYFNQNLMKYEGM